MLLGNGDEHAAGEPEQGRPVPARLKQPLWPSKDKCCNAVGGARDQTFGENKG